MPARKVICFVVSSVELTAQWFLLEHIAAMTEIYDVCLVGNCRDKDYLRRRGIDVDVLFVPIVREISPLKDLKALLALWSLFKKRKFDIVHSVSPKAGLLAMLAAKLAWIPIRIHMFTGQVWVTSTGMKRPVLKTMDKLMSACATNVLVDSNSQMEFLIRERVVTSAKASVLANGSIQGVDTNRFQPRPDVRIAMRAKLNIPAEAMLFAYVGRMKRDKGVLDLAAAFSQVCIAQTDAYLMFVGHDEELLTDEIESLCSRCADRLRIVGPSPVPEDYFASADVLCLPSYREGFGSVVIEAAACEVPALASRIYGVSDAIRENETGMFHKAGDVEDLKRGMMLMIKDRERRMEMGKRARVRAVADFSTETVTTALVHYYQRELSHRQVGRQSAGSSLPA